MKKTALMVIFFLAGGLNASAKDLYVSPSAEPGGQGTFSAPFASLGEAQATVRKVIAEEAEQDITVYLRDGEYYLHETLVLGLQDSPADGFSLYFKAYKDEKPVLTSAVPIGNWQKLEALHCLTETGA
jgi:hypothetical protein